MRLSRAFCALAVPFCSAAIALGGELPTSRSITLSEARVSTPGAGSVVIALHASGDLRGLVTLTLHPDGDSPTGVTGEWSLASSYVQDLDENGNPIEIAHDDDTDPGVADGISREHHEEGVPHVERIRFVNLGTIGGTVDAGQLILGADGRVAGLAGVHLTIVSSSLTFEGAAGGGSLEASDLGDSGTLTVTF